MTKMSLVKAFIDRPYKDSLLMELASEKIIHIKENKPEDQSKEKEQTNKNKLKEIDKSYTYEKLCLNRTIPRPCCYLRSKTCRVRNLKRSNRISCSDTSKEPLNPKPVTKEL